jgi:hypothetical protein
MRKSVMKNCMLAALAVFFLAIVVLPFLGYSAPEGFLDAKRDYGCDRGVVCPEGTFCQKNNCVKLYPQPTITPEGAGSE